MFPFTNLECPIADGRHNYFKVFNTLLIVLIVPKWAILIKQPTHWYSRNSGTKCPQNKKDFSESKSFYCLQLIFTVSVTKEICPYNVFTDSINLVPLLVRFCEFTSFFRKIDIIKSSRLQYYKEMCWKISQNLLETNFVGLCF